MFLNKTTGTAVCPEGSSSFPLTTTGDVCKQSVYSTFSFCGYIIIIAAGHINNTVVKYLHKNTYWGYLTIFLQCILKIDSVYDGTVLIALNFLNSIMISVAYLEKINALNAWAAPLYCLSWSMKCNICSVHSHYTHFDCLLLLQVVSMWTLRAGAVRTSTCTGSTSTVTCWWCAPRHAASSTCGMRSAALTNCPRTSTRCACSPKPWTRPRTASWACCSSGTRSRRTSANRRSGAELKKLDACFLFCICS